MDSSVDVISCFIDVHYEDESLPYNDSAPLESTSSIFALSIALYGRLVDAGKSIVIFGYCRINTSDLNHGRGTTTNQSSQMGLTKHVCTYFFDILTLSILSLLLTFEEWIQLGPTSNNRSNWIGDRGSLRYCEGHLRRWWTFQSLCFSYLGISTYCGRSPGDVGVTTCRGTDYSWM